MTQAEIDTFINDNAYSAMGEGMCGSDWVMSVEDVRELLAKLEAS